MLPQLHFITLKKIFFKRIKRLCLYAISCIRQPAAQKPDKIHVLNVRKFCKSILGVGVFKLPPAGQIRPRKPFQPAHEDKIVINKKQYFAKLLLIR